MGASETLIYRFSNVEVDVSRRRIRRDGVDYYLREKTFQVLLYLIGQRSRIVPRQELFQRLWPEAFVTDDALAKCIGEIRTVLGDDPARPRFVKTFRKVGYRFLSPVEELPVRTSNTTPPPSPPAAVREPPPPAARPKSPPAVMPGRAARRRALILVPVVTLVFGAVLGLYLAFSSFSFDRPVAEVVLTEEGKIPVLVLYFENRSHNSELDWLKEGLADMIITDLSRSARLALLSRQQLHVLMERNGRSSRDEIRLEDAMDLARRSRAKVVVFGSFVQLDRRIRIDVQLHDAESGRLLAAEGMTADEPGQLLAQVDLLSLKLAEHLGARSRADDPPLNETMTASLEAYRYYSLAVENLQAYHTDEAIELLQKAINVDPEFAMAHARIGYAHALIWNNERDKALPHLEKAFRLAHRLRERDRLFLNAWYALALADNEAAIRAFRRIINLYPREIEAYLRLGYLLRGQGKKEEAIELYRRALVIDPEAADVYNALGFLYTGEDAITAHRRYVQLLPHDANSHDSLALSYIEAGRYREAADSLEQALSLQPDFHFAHLHRADVFYGVGRFREAETRYRRYLELAPSDWDRAVGYHRLVRLYLRMGEVESAARAARGELSHGNDFGGSLLVALQQGNLETAEALLQQLLEDSAYIEEETLPQERFLEYFRGRVALARGDLEDGLRRLRAAATDPSHLWNVDGVVDSLAVALLELGRWDEAASECRRLLAINPRYPWAHYYHGVALENRGEIEAARVAYRRFLEIWHEADPDRPKVLHARQFF